MSTPAKVVVFSQRDGSREDAGVYEFDVMPETADYLYLRDGRKVYVLQRSHVAAGNEMRFELLVEVVEQ